MPAKPAQEPERTPAPTRTTEATTPKPTPELAVATPEPDIPEGRLPAGVYEFTGTLPTQYLEVPLTARPTGPGQAATVFDWPFSAPDDGRWQPTKKKPNQVADNAPAVPPEE